jgi:hypothetical protein
MRIKRPRCKSIVDQNRHVETVYEFSECVQVGSYVELVLQELGCKHRYQTREAF